MRQSSPVYRNYRKLLLATAVALAGAKAVAVEPASYDAGAFDIYPSITISAAQDDNIFNSNTNETDSLVTTIAPRFRAVLEDGDSSYAVNYSLEKGMVSSSSDDNYLDQVVSLSTTQVVDLRTKFALGAAYSTGHEQRGTGISRGNLATVTEPVEFHTTSYLATYTFGADNAAARLDASAAYDRKIYDNFRALTAAQDQRSLELGLQFGINVSDKTAILLEIRNTDIDYLLAASAQDSEETKLLAGIGWRATGKTSGTIRVGSVDKNFDSAAVSDFSGTTWEASIVYDWKTYSSFELASSSEPLESFGFGNFIDSTQHVLSWDHDWSEQLSSSASASFLDQEFDGTAQSEETTSFGVDLTYNFRRYMDITFSISNEELSSNNAAVEYSGNVVGLSTVITL